MNDFHMVFEQDVIKRIEKAAKSAGCSFSAMGRYLLTIGLNRMERTYWTEGSKKSRWKKAGKTVKRKHVFIPLEIYKQLKKIHLECNVYSMAQIFRRIVDVVLDIVDKKGFEFAVEFFKKNKKKSGMSTFFIGKAVTGKHMHIEKTMKTTFTLDYNPIMVEFT